jgi:hypothetical protein
MYIVDQSLNGASVNEKIDTADMRGEERSK